MESDRLYRDTISAGYSTHNQLEAWRLQDELERFNAFGSDISLYGIGSGDSLNSIPVSAAEKGVSDFDPILQEIKQPVRSTREKKSRTGRRTATPIHLLLRTEEDLGEPNSLYESGPKEKRVSGSDLSSSGSSSASAALERTVSFRLFDDSPVEAPSSSRAQHLDDSDVSATNSDSLLRRVDPAHDSGRLDAAIPLSMATNASAGKHAAAVDDSCSGTEEESLLYKFTGRLVESDKQTRRDAISQPEIINDSAGVRQASKETDVQPSAEGVSPFDYRIPAASDPVLMQEKPMQSVSMPEKTAKGPKRKESFLMSFRWPLCYMGVMALAAGGGIVGYSVFSNQTPFYNTGLAIATAGTIGLGCAITLSFLGWLGSALFKLSGFGRRKEAPNSVSAPEKRSASSASDPASAPAFQSLEEQVLQLQAVISDMQQKKAA